MSYAKKYDLGCIVTTGILGLFMGTLAGGGSNVGLHKHRRVHKQPALILLALDLALFWLAYTLLGRQQTSWTLHDVPIVQEAVLGQAARDKVQAHAAIFSYLRHVQQMVHVRECSHQGVHLVVAL